MSEFSYILCTLVSYILCSLMNIHSGIGLICHFHFFPLVGSAAAPAAYGGNYGNPDPNYGGNPYPAGYGMNPVWFICNLLELCACMGKLNIIKLFFCSLNWRFLEVLRVLLLMELDLGMVLGVHMIHRELLVAGRDGACFGPCIA